MWKQQLKEIKKKLKEGDRSDNLLDNVSKKNKVPYGTAKKKYSNENDATKKEFKGSKNKESNNSLKIYAPTGGGIEEVKVKTDVKVSPTAVFDPIVDFSHPDRTLVCQFSGAGYSDSLLEHNPDDVGSEQNDGVDLIIGLDFGTAFTKVVIGDGAFHYVVSFPGAGKILPSSFTLNEQGECSLNFDTGRHIKDLKLPFLKGQERHEDLVAISCFLALVFKRCREWKMGSVYSSNTPRWLINMGLPTATYEDDDVKKKYKKLINASWCLSFHRSIFVSNVSLVLDDFLSNRAAPIDFLVLHEDQINIFAEFSAQLAGYVMSPLRRKFAHLLVDVGAGTLDVALFNVDQSDGDWLFKVYSKSIDNYGVEIFHGYRVLRCKGSFERSELEISISDDAFAERFGISLNDLKNIDSDFRKAVNAKVVGVINLIGPSSTLSEPITLFLCGGGRNIDVYNCALSPIFRDYPVNYVEMPQPERIRGLDDDDEFHRFSVAYGLSFDPYDLGAVVYPEYKGATVAKERSQGFGEKFEGARAQYEK